MLKPTLILTTFAVGLSVLGATLEPVGPAANPLSYSELTLISGGNGDCVDDGTDNCPSDDPSTCSNTSCPGPGSCPSDVENHNSNKEYAKADDDAASGNDDTKNLTPIWCRVEYFCAASCVPNGTNYECASTTFSNGNHIQVTPTAPDGPACP
jgi:hypothetical protein